MQNPLSQRAYARAVRALSERDRDLGRVVESFGPPPMWDREPGFGTLVYLILEQQVSLASARATYERLAASVGDMAPQKLLGLDGAAMRALGVSRQKARYTRLLAEAVAAADLDLGALSSLADDDVRAQLTRITGIGRWTADIYLLMALRRPDVWPVGDLALAVAAQEVKALAERPKAAALLELGEAWRPWRAVAARILWHYYLNTRRIKRG